MKMRLPAGLNKISRRLREQGRSAWLVGGAVRDWFLGKQIKDFDVATDAAPEEVMRLFRRVIPTGLKHGTVTVLEGGGQYEVTTFRTEGAYTDGRRPDAVAWTTDLDEDLKRRDFTINALAYDLSAHRLHDPFGGRRDLKRRIIRAIGDPGSRLREDALRILRAVRLSAQLGFTIEAETEAALCSQAPLLVRISAERIRDEFDKILAAAEPSAGLFTLSRLEILRVFLPELEACRGVTQPALHCFDVFSHSLYSCDGSPSGNPVVRLAALFHDLGKPATGGVNKQGDPCFYHHEEAGARLAGEILFRLRYPTAVIEAVKHLIRCHMWQYDEAWTDAAVRRFIRRVGRDNMADLFALRRADLYGFCRRPVPPGALRAVEERVAAINAEATALSIKDLAVNGDDLKRELALPEGKTIGVILDFLLETVLDDPAQNERDRLLVIARRFFDERLR